MLTEWKLQNFKSIKELPDFGLSPVTVLAGPNSSGKTALLQSILMVAQTLSSPVEARTLVLNGEAVKLGTWSDIPHCDLQEQPLVLGCSIDFSKEPSAYDFDSELGARQGLFRRRRVRQPINTVKLSVSFVTHRHRAGDALEPAVESVHVSTEKGRTTTKRAQASPMPLSIAIRHRMRSRPTRQLAEWEPLLPSGVNREALSYMIRETRPERLLDLDEDFGFLDESVTPTNNIGATFKHFLPLRFVQSYDATSRQLRQHIRDFTASGLPSDVRRQRARDFAKFMNKTMLAGSDRLPQELVGRMNRFVDALGVKKQFTGTTTSEFTTFLATMFGKARSDRPPVNLSWVLDLVLQPFVTRQARQFAIEAKPIPEFARAGLAMVEDFFANKIRYLGPLRDDPRVIYALPPTPDIPDVGVKGQYTAVVLDRNKTRRVKFIDPPTMREREATLQEAVVSWLQHMGMLQSVSTEDAGKLGYKLTIHVSGVDRELDLTTVGVGASQVLPILVMALLAAPGTLLIFEQPEIHLHPKLQSILGDFFLSMGQLGKQCLVETHSEYLVNRLRIRIAEADDDEILRLVKMYFVERPGNASLFREVMPNEYGAILEWPDGFFDEGTLQAESMLRVAAQKRIRRTAPAGNEDSN